MPDPECISIVTPCFQSGRFLAETMESVVSQDYPNVEYIVMDGGSTDGSVEIIRGYADRIAHWQSAPDGGQTDAICRGFELSHGDVVAWINADDYYLPGAFAAVMAEFAAHPDVDVIYGYSDLVDAEGRVRQTHYDIEFDFATTLFAVCPMYQPEVFVRRRVLENLGPPRRELNMLMDTEWWLRMGKAGVRFHRLDRKVVCFRFHPATKSLTLTEQQQGERRRIVDEYWTRFRPANQALSGVVFRLFSLYYRLRRQWKLTLRYGHPISYYKSTR